MVDDDPVTLALVEQALENAGHQVWTSENASQVSRWVLEYDIDALVLDVMLPDTSGFELLRRLRSEPRTGGLPILILSARGDTQDRVHGLREGADDYLSKPFDVEELALRVDRLVAQRAGQKQDDVGIEMEDLERSLVDHQVVGKVYLGRYQALEMVGEGAMGMVFRGWDPRLKRPVALKTLRIQTHGLDFDRPSMISNLLQEAVTVAKLNHPNLVAVHDVAHGPQTAFIAMEYVNGISLATHLQDQAQLPQSQVIVLARAVAEALDAAHRHHVVHHDVKPGNVLLGYDGGIKVTDFGVAHLGNTLAGDEDKVFGTPGYLPPETLLNEGYSYSGDLFGLGSMLYQCLVGELPFTGRTLPQVVLSTVRDQVEPVSQRVEGIEPALDALILGLLAKKPQDRIGSAAEVIERLADIEVEAWVPPSRKSKGAATHPTAQVDIGEVGGHSCQIPIIDPTVPLENYLDWASK